MSRELSRAAWPPSLSRGVDVILKEIAEIGEHAGVYRMLGEGGEVLYVGKAKYLRRRVMSYTRPTLLPQRIRRMIALTFKMEFITTRTEAEALLLEANLIKSLKPKYNVLLKDDKSYPYILLTTDHDYPQLLKFRGKATEKGKYFGPFASGYAVSETLSFLQRVFRLRNCSDSYFAARKSPCLQYHIKRCTAPCVAKVTREEYAQQVKDTSDFLKGKSREIQERLLTQMQAAAQAEEFEQAAQLRDRIKMLTQIQSLQGLNSMGIGDADIIAVVQREGSVCIQMFTYRASQNYGNKPFFMNEDQVENGAGSLHELLSGFMAQLYQSRPAPPKIFTNIIPHDADVLEDAFGVQIKTPQRGDVTELIKFAERNAQEALTRHLLERGSNKKLLQDVAALFGLDDIPRRIEIYDNSHVSGTNMVGAMVVAGPEGFEKKSYRTYNIRMASASDDYGMMREVMQRRFGKIDAADYGQADRNWPQLLLIDGGLGQLNAVHEVLDALGASDHLTIVGIAKGEDRNAGREKFFIKDQEMFQLPINDPVLHYLQRLRDEAHRFAIGTHRARRKKSGLTSRLDDVPGIGAARKKALLHHFGSSKSVEDASLDQLLKVPGVSKSVAEKIYNFFRN